MDDDETMAQDGPDLEEEDEENTEVVVRAGIEPAAAAIMSDRDALMAGVAAGNIHMPAGHATETMELPQASSSFCHSCTQPHRQTTVRQSDTVGLWPHTCTMLAACSCGTAGF